MQTKQPESRTMSASQVRSHWSEVVERVHHGDARVIVERSGIPVAVVISPQDYELFLKSEAEREKRFRVLEESWKAFEGVPLEEIEREVAQAIAEVRAERRAKSESSS
jgi:prevent-host-death family protein